MFCCSFVVVSPSFFVVLNRMNKGSFRFWRLVPRFSFPNSRLPLQESSIASLFVVSGYKGYSSSASPTIVCQSCLRSFEGRPYDRVQHTKLTQNIL